MRPLRTVRFGVPSRRLVIAGTIVAVLALTLAASRPADAAYPGKNGKIAFSTYRDWTYQIYVMNADGTGQTRLVSTTEDTAPVWSSDGTKIAFRISGGLPVGNPGGIFVMNPDGSGRRQVSRGEDELPTWSPDMKRIAFNRFEKSPSGAESYEVYVVNSNGSGGEVQLTSYGADNAHPSWSPDGTKIAFISLRDGNPEIYVMNADGSNPQRLTTNPANDYYPDWSPDGRKIAFSSLRDGQFETYVMSPDGSNVTRIAPGFDCADPSWSPDGSRIACNKSGYGSQIWVMDPDGSNPVQLTSGFLDNGADWQPVVWGKPVIAKPIVWTTIAAGEIVIATFKVTRSDNGKSLTVGKMSFDPSIERWLIRHTESFKNGSADVRFRIPKTVKAKQLTLRLTITYQGQTASRTATLRIR